MEYFQEQKSYATPVINRCSTREAKRIKRIDMESLVRLQSYPWPGNIRELQNVIERSVIVCDSENFSVDESWLTQFRIEVGRSSKGDAARRSNELVRQGKDLIESALARSRGKIAGTQGAAELLGMPVSTLNSKIKALKIDKHRFRSDLAN